MKALMLVIGIAFFPLTLTDLDAQKKYCSGSFVSYSYDNETSSWVHSFTVDGISIQITTCFNFSSDNGTIQVENSRSLNLTLNVDKMTYEPEKKSSIACNSGPNTFYQITLDLFNNKIILVTMGGGKMIKQEHFIEQL